MDATHLEELLQQGKLEEARQELQAILQGSELTEKERGEVLVRFAELRMNVGTHLNRRYTQALQDGIDRLREVDKAVSNVERNSKLAQIKKDVLGK